MRVRPTVRGRIATCGGRGDLLLDPCSFLSRPQYRSLLDLRDHHFLQQLFNGVNGLVCLHHHTFKLWLLACYLGKINLCVLRRPLFSRPLGWIRGVRLILTFRGLVLSQILGTSPPRHSGYSICDQNELGKNCWNVTGGCPPSSAKLLTYDFDHQRQWITNITKRQRNCEEWKILSTDLVIKIKD